MSEDLNNEIQQTVNYDDETIRHLSDVEHIRS